MKKKIKYKVINYVHFQYTTFTFTVPSRHRICFFILRVHMDLGSHGNFTSWFSYLCDIFLLSINNAILDFMI